MCSWKREMLLHISVVKMVLYKSCYNRNVYSMSC